MRTARTKSLLERSADSDLWRHTLSQIPTLIGRLVYLSALRSPITGKYEHHGFALLFGDSEADRAIRVSHRKTFGEFLTASLEEKVEDIESYLRSTGEVPRDIVRHWAKSDIWTAFVPSNTLSAEKSLFSSEMRNSIRVLTARFGDAVVHQSA
jgi:hypothetical protein